MDMYSHPNYQSVGTLGLFVSGRALHLLGGFECCD